VYSVLAVCDNIQTWDRELEVDPAGIKPPEGLLERLVLSDNAYVSGSEIRSFALSRQADIGTYGLAIRLRYFLEGTRGADELSDNLGNEIQKWIGSGRLREVCLATGMSAILHGEIWTCPQI
jgi:hypothetical protein